MKIKIWKIVGLLSIVIFMLSTAASAQAATLTTTIATHVTPIGVVYDPVMHEIFVSNYDSGDIQVISDSTNTQVADITALTQYAGPPYNMAYDSGKSEIWVADATGAYAISDSTNQIVANVTTNAPPSWGTLTQAVYDPKTGEVFISYSDFTGASTPYIQVISDSTNTVIANLTQAAVTGIVDDSAKSEIFASQYLDSSGSISGNVYVISAKTNTVTTTIPIGGIPGLEAYDSVKGEIFVANSIWNSSAPGGYSHVIEVISDSTNKIIATITVPTSVFSGPMAYNPDKGEIYINVGASVAIISDKTNNVVGTVNINGTISSSEGIAYDSGTSTVYAINNPGSLAGYMGSLAVISDPSSSSSSTSPSPTPTVPEFSNVAVASIVVVMIIASFAVALKAKRSKKQI
jgi:DNA-binding beta-propeller fold protein YncE